MKIYAAGPLGFSEAGKCYHRKIIGALENLGHEVLDPWTLTDAQKIKAAINLPYGIEKRSAWAKLNREIGENNRAAIDRCDAVFAVLDGADVDSGTASEIGYAFAKGKPILGYRGDTRLSADNEGAVINLQVEYFVRQSGGDIIRHFEEIPDALTGINGDKSMRGRT